MSLDQTQQQGAFPPTRWTLVARAGEDSGDSREIAIEELCKTYWPPIYAYLRSRGNSPEEAEDLVQGFFADFLQRDHFVAANRDKGKLRTYLLRSVSNFANRMYRDGTRLKRGGVQKVLSLDSTDEAGERSLPEPADGLTPESAFERQWPLTLLDRVFQTLRDEYEQKGKGDQFEALKFSISTQFESRPYVDVAVELGCSPGAVKVAAHRLRERYQRTLRETIADTILPDEEVDQELRELMRAFD
jgi:RNA polymerase sigma-70 factor (ECF subfamily)